LKFEFWNLNLHSSIFLFTFATVKFTKLIMENEQDNPILFRLKQFLASTGLSSTQFADKAGIPRPTFSQLLHGRNKSINNQILVKLDENFPELNTLWLLFGRGSMHVNSNSEISEAQNSDSDGLLKSQPTAMAHVTEEKKTEYRRSQGLQTTTISDLLGQNMRQQPEKADTPSDSGAWSASVLCSPADEDTPKSGKKITSIIVLYSDSSFETFLPSEK